MTRADCLTCRALAAAGVDTREAEVCPPQAEQLEVFPVGEGHGGSTQLRRCRTCGTLYRYRHHSEYDVTGSWDEDWLWRVPDAAAALVAPLLGALDDERFDAALTQALRSPLPGATGAAAVVAWIASGAGRRFTTALVAQAEVLPGPDAYACNHCYRALLAYLRRGQAEARAVLAALQQSGAVEKDPQYTRVLLREVSAVLR